MRPVPKQGSSKGPPPRPETWFGGFYTILRRSILLLWTPARVFARQVTAEVNISGLPLLPLKPLTLRPWV